MCAWAIFCFWRLYFSYSWKYFLKSTTETALLLNYFSQYWKSFFRSTVAICQVVHSSWCVPERWTWRRCGVRGGSGAESLPLPAAAPPPSAYCCRGEGSASLSTTPGGTTLTVRTTTQPSIYTSCKIVVLISMSICNHKMEWFVSLRKTALTNLDGTFLLFNKTVTE